MLRHYNRNENMFGPAPACIHAWRKFNVSKSYLYADKYFEARFVSLLEKKFSVERKNIIIGYGSEDIIKRDIINELLRHGNILLTNELHFTFFDELQKIKHYQIKEFSLIKESDYFKFNWNDLTKKFKKFKPALTIIASPNNPTGHTIKIQDFIKFLEVTQKSSGIVILDEAYWGFGAGLKNYEVNTLLKRFPNLIITRTLSKFYALAGLRIGFAFAGGSAIKKIRYQLPYLGYSQILDEIATAALKSQKHYKEKAGKIIIERENLLKSINKLTYFKAYKSFASFILVEVNNKKARGDLTRMFNKKYGHNVHIAKFVNDNYVRISIGKPRYNYNFLRQLRKIDLKYKKRN